MNVERDLTPVETSVEAVADAPKQEAPVAKPGDDLRQIQNLLVAGIYPGNMAPAIIKAHQLLGALADKVDQTNEPK